MINEFSTPHSNVGTTISDKAQTYFLIDENATQTYFWINCQFYISGGNNNLRILTPISKKLVPNHFPEHLLFTQVDSALQIGAKVKNFLRLSYLQNFIFISKDNIIHIMYFSFQRDDITNCFTGFHAISRDLRIS